MMTQPRLRLTRVSPHFLVDDVVASAEYYRDILGFKFDRYWPAPEEGTPCFVILIRDEAEISLGNPGARGLARPNRKAHSDAAWDVYIWVTDILAVESEFRAKGAKILRGPEKTLYHCHEVEIEDCNGYVLCFAQDISPAE